MITLTAEVICDTCKQVVAPAGPSERMSSWLIHEAETKAKSLGAHIGISIVTCAECLDKAKLNTVREDCSLARDKILANHEAEATAILPYSTLAKHRRLKRGDRERRLLDACKTALPLVQGYLQIMGGTHADEIMTLLETAINENEGPPQIYGHEGKSKSTFLRKVGTGTITDCETT